MGSGGQRQKQLTLPVQLREETTLDNFLVLPANRSLLNALRSQLQPGGEPVVFLHGASGSGKSHLLQGSCHLAGGGALYLPLAELAGFAPEEILQGVESMDIVCLDDLQAVLGDREWEVALFDFYNRARAQDCALLIAADAAPRALQVGLADLRSRLAWGVVFQLARATDEDRAEILRFRAGRRGLELTPEVAAYIVHRAPRSITELLSLLDRLDSASLAEQRALSIPFVKQALAW